MSRFDPNLPLEHALTLPSRFYIDHAIGQLERDCVFARSWLVACRVEELQESGQFVTKQIAGEPIVLVRDESSRIRAFFNVCRHHAAIVQPEECGTATKFRCPYHGWTYGLDGKLKGVPEFEGVDFQREEFGLLELPVRSWGRWLWVCTSPETPSFDRLVEPINTGTIPELRFFEKREYELACNWKIYVDNYLDGGYHVPVAHPSLGGVLDYSQYRTNLFELSVVQTSPLKPSTDPAAIVRQGDEAAYWWLWPNFMINIYDDVMDTNLVEPLGPDRCRVTFEFFFGKTTPEFQHQSIEVAERIQQEDIAICESVQRGLRSRAYDTGRYSVRREAGMYHFHRLLAERYGDAAQ